MKPGETVKLGVVRGTENMTIDATLGTVPATLPPVKSEENPPMPEHHRGFLGMGVSDVPSALAYQLNLKEHEGVLVGDVVKDSPAAKAGIETNDIVTSIDGKAIEGGHKFVEALSGKNPGDEVKIDFIDKGARKTADVKLGEWPKDLSAVHGAGGQIPFPGHSWFGMPHWSKGRMIIKGPEGSEQVFQLPESPWKADELFKDLEKNFKEYQSNPSPEMRQGIEKALKELEGKVKENGTAQVGNESRMAIIRNVEGEYDITVRDQNGVRTVTVLKDGKSIAKDLPWDKLDSLAPDVRDRVQKTADSLKVGPMTGLPIEKEETGIKA
jgi:membrane-associated protease RseP (regulator of RpoE activity)